jgi:hypothetical protein
MYCDLIENDYRQVMPFRVDLIALFGRRGQAWRADMTKVSLVTFVLGAATLSAATPAAAKAEPQVLTVAELDTITAAGASVDVDTFAAAFGNDATAVTDVRTLVIDSPWVSAGIGWGVGAAVACCGPASSVDVRASVHGEGDLVRGRAVQLERDNGVLAVGVATGWILAISRMLPTALRPLAKGPPRGPRGA